MENGKRRWVWFILRQIAGYACLVIGVAGLILPLLPGVPMLIAGLGLLAVDSPWAARLRDKLKAATEKQLARLHRKSAPPSEQA